MKAKKIFENIKFKRGQDIQNGLDVGKNSTQNIKSQLQELHNIMKNNPLYRVGEIEQDNNEITFTISTTHGGGMIDHSGLELGYMFVPWKHNGKRVMIPSRHPDKKDWELRTGWFMRVGYVDKGDDYLIEGQDSIFKAWDRVANILKTIDIQKSIAKYEAIIEGYKKFQRFRTENES